MSGKNATERLTADDAGLSRAASMLRSGGLVALPTETVYGLAARADDAQAVKRIFLAKGRPSYNPLIIHVADLSQARLLAEFGVEAEAMATEYWPGPLTMVLPKRVDARLTDAITAGLPTIAIRMPAHPVMQHVIRRVGVPLAAPSANRSGYVSPTDVDHVLSTLDGKIDAVLDGGPCTDGVESTIIALRNGGEWQVLRPGPIDLPEKLRGATFGASKIEAPGQLASHYAPGKPMRLEATEAGPEDFMIGFGEVAGDCNLSATGNLTHAASALYACLHQGAASIKPRIAVAPIPQQGIGLAINDRLKRAAS